MEFQARAKNLNVQTRGALAPTEGTNLLEGPNDLDDPHKIEIQDLSPRGNG